VHAAPGSNGPPVTKLAARERNFQSRLVERGLLSIAPAALSDGALHRRPAPPRAAQRDAPGTLRVYGVRISALNHVDRGAANLLSDLHSNLEAHEWWSTHRRRSTSRTHQYSRIFDAGDFVANNCSRVIDRSGLTLGTSLADCLDWRSSPPMKAARKLSVI
jgi:hypothetical protein